MHINGDCYEIAGKHMLENAHSNDILCHGEVTGQGELNGIKYGHAWIERGDLVIDKSNGRNIQMPKLVYYILGKIGQPSFDQAGNYHEGKTNVHRYSYPEFSEKILEFGHWGPWDLKTETGL